jgi:2-dehydropantoate 2-reductase
MVSCIDGARATSNIWGERWSKLTTNASSNPVSAMTGLGAQGVAGNVGARMLQIHICKESAQVGQALRYDIESMRGVKADVWTRADEGDVYEDLEARFMPSPGATDWKSSMAQDVTKGRRTEIEYMNGYIVDRGREMGISTPVNAAIVEVVREIDAGHAQPNPANVERTLAMAGLKP